VVNLVKAPQKGNPVIESMPPVDAEIRENKDVGDEPISEKGPESIERETLQGQEAHQKKDSASDEEDERIF
jgi:hypothetical protein